MNELRIFRHRRADTHKGDYGHVLVIGGSVGFSGAPMLAARAALRAGAGLVSVAVPEPIYFIAAVQSLEAMVHPLPAVAKKGVFSAGAMAALKPLLARANVLAIGPGISQEPSAQRFVRELVQRADLPIVLDADGINAFAGRSRALLRKVKRPLILTPHPGELARLLGLSIASVQRNRQRIAAQAAQELCAIVVLKGHRTVVAGPAHAEQGRSRNALYINRTGNPGMATAGTGDILTGIIAALIAQGFAPFAAARTGVYLHGLAGDLAARRVGQPSLIASDLLAALPAAFNKK